MLGRLEVREAATDTGLGADLAARERLLLDALGADDLDMVEAMMPGARAYLAAWAEADRLLLLDGEAKVEILNPIDDAIADPQDADLLGRVIFALLPNVAATGRSRLASAEAARCSERVADVAARTFPVMMHLLDDEHAAAYVSQLPLEDARGVQAWRIAWRLLHTQGGAAWNQLADFIDTAAHDSISADSLKPLILMLLPPPVAEAVSAEALAADRATAH